MQRTFCANDKTDMGSEQLWVDYITRTYASVLRCHGDAVLQESNLAFLRNSSVTCVMQFASTLTPQMCPFTVTEPVRSRDDRYPWSGMIRGAVDGDRRIALRVGDKRANAVEKAWKSLRLCAKSHVIFAGTSEWHGPEGRPRIGT